MSALKKAGFLYVHISCFFCIKIHVEVTFVWCYAWLFLRYISITKAIIKDNNMKSANATNATTVSKYIYHATDKCIYKSIYVCTRLFVALMEILALDVSACWKLWSILSDTKGQGNTRKPDINMKIRILVFSEWYRSDKDRRMKEFYIIFIYLGTA